MRGVHITLTDPRGEEPVQRDLSAIEGGISQLCRRISTRTAAVEVLHDEMSSTSRGEQNRSTVAEVAMQYNDSYNELLLSFANNIHTTDGGTHEAGFKTALTRALNDYARKICHSQGQRQEPHRR